MIRREVRHGFSARRSQLAVGTLLALAIGGCGGSATVTSQGPPQVSHRVEQVISNKLLELRGVRPKSVACPQSMEPQKGKMYRCTITAANGDTIGATVTMQGGTNFQFAVDQRPAR